LVDVEGGGQAPVVDGEDGFDDAGDAGGGLGVADVGFDRAQQEGALSWAVAVGGDEGLGFDGVAEGGAGAVGFDGVDVVGLQAGVGEGGVDDALLGGAVGGGQAVAGAVLVDCGAGDQRQHGVAVAAGRGQPLQGDDSDPVGEPGAVGGGGERLAPAVGGQAALPGELHEKPRVGHDGRAAG
jgi:hypothetical protein